MFTQHNFYIHKTGEYCMFALRLKRFVLATAIPGYGEQYLEGLRRRQIDWFTTLLGSGGQNTVFDLRVISRPNDVSGEGTIEVAVLCKCPANLGDRNYPNQVLKLTQTYFENEYEFTPIETKEEFERFQSPFQISDCIHIERRYEILSLDTPVGQRNRSLGFRPTMSEFEKSDDRIFHVYPFVPTGAVTNHLFSLLLRNEDQLLISFRISKTSLTTTESKLITSQISRCENYVHSRTDHNEETGVFSKHGQANVLKKAFLRSLGAWNNSAVFMQIEVAGESTVPETVVEMLGTILTKPSAHSEDHLEPDVFLSGGFTYKRSDKGEVRKLSKSLNDLSFSLNSDERVPKGAKRLRYLFDNSEAASVFHFPVPTVSDLPGLDCKSYRTQLIRGNVEKGQLVGYSHHNSFSKAVRLGRTDRRRHVYAVGQTGTGKSTMFASMILEDMHNNEGLCVIDPHGDLIDKILGKVPPHRANDVIVFDPGDLERPFGFNVLEYESEAQKHFLIQELLAIIDALVPDKSMMGPMFFQHSKMVLQLAMSNPKKMGTLAQFYQVFAQDGFYERFLPLPKPDSLLQAFIDFSLSKNTYTRIGSDGSSMGGYIGSKFEPFIGDPMLRNIFGQRRSTVDLKRIMDEGKILLVNLSKGRMGELNARFFGMVLIAKLQAAVMARATAPDKDRRDFYLYVDEFQNLATQNFGVLLAEARKYRLNLILTNQFVSQVPPTIREAITGNVGTLISFRVGSTDAEYLERDFIPTFSRYDLMNLPNFNTYVSTLIDGQVTTPFSMRIVSGLPKEKNEVSNLIRNNSRVKYGRSRQEVEKEIEVSLGFPHAHQYRLDKMDFSVRTRGRLEKSGFATLSDIVRFTKEEMRTRFGFGKKCVCELDNMLITYGFAFQSEEEKAKSIMMMIRSGHIQPIEAAKCDLELLDLSPSTVRFLKNAEIDTLIQISLNKRSNFIKRYSPPKDVVREIDDLHAQLGYSFVPEHLRELDEIAKEFDYDEV